MRKPEASAKPTNWLALGFIFAFTLHIWLAQHIGLTVDDAHYALYAALPALSYFDHPPLVGWVQIPFIWLGAEDWMFRIAPLILWCLTAWMLHRFSKWALILFLLSPMHELLGVALLPDTLLFPLTLWVMALTQRLLKDVTDVKDWLWLGVALGLAGLSKYTGVSLALGVVLVLMPRYGTRLFQQRGLWFAVAIAGLMISPVLIWNMQHDWISFTYQFDHAAGGDNSWQTRRIPTYITLQVMAYGVLPLAGLTTFYWKLRHRFSDVFYIHLAFGVPLLMLMVLLAGKGASMPHWSAAAWIALMPAAALGLEHTWQNTKSISLTIRKTFIFVLCGLQSFAILTLVYAISTGGRPLGSPNNPFTDFYDWKAGAYKARALQEKYRVDALAVSNWTLASRIAWYAYRSGGTHTSQKVVALDGKNKQFEMWFGQLKHDESFIWINWSQKPFQPPASCKPLSAEDARYEGTHSYFDFYLCRQP